MSNKNAPQKESLQPLIEEMLRYFKINCKDLTGEKALWQSVVMQAVIDAISKPKDIKSKIERAKTRAWFSINNENFILVCLFAELNPDFIIKGLKNILKKNKKPYILRHRKKNRELDKLAIKSTKVKKKCHRASNA